MAKFFIDRPIFAWVIAIFIIALGVIGIRSLPVSQYPSVAAPTITLTATYPGASAQVMEDSVLAVIERSMNGVEGLDYMSTSANSSGSGTVSLTFTPETNEDLAQVEVQNKLSEVLSNLPAAVQQYGVTVSKARENFLMIVMLSSDVHSIEEMNDYAQRNIVPELQRIDGVGKVQLFGAQRAMRIWVDPKKLQNYNLSFSTVTNALSAQNVQISAGSIGSLPAAQGQTISATVTAQGQLSTAEEFGNIILVSNTDGSNVYLKDVAKVSLGMEDYSASIRLNGVNTTGMAVMLSNSGNALATATAVQEKMATLKKYFPQGMSWKNPYNTSKFVDLSIQKVIHTLLEAIALVFLVMFLFLQNIRYTLIPTIVVPISLLGGFAFISYMGMSINVLTMFAMVLVIGIVVDDAIVVVENVERIMATEGLPPKEATKKGENMAFLQVDDSKKKLDVTLFSDLYRQVGQEVREGAFYYIRGKIQSRDGRLQMIAQEIREAVAERFWIQVKNHESDQEISHILEQYKGPIPVIIRYEEEQKTIVSPHHFVAKSDELEAQLDGMVMKTIYR